MRDASIAVLREIGVETGGSNVQFAVNPADGRMVVIEMNPRVSRSSALGLEGDRVSDRQGRRQARGRLHARRDRQRHHRRRDAGLVRADDRLYRHENPALRVREISRRRADADDGDEVGRRSDGDRPHLPRIAAEGAALAGDGPRRARRDRDRRAGPRRRPQRAARRDRPADARSPAQCGAGDALGDGRRRDPRMQQDRPLVPRTDRRDRRARRQGARSWPAAGCGQHARAQGERLLRRASRGACRQGRGRRRRGPQTARRPAGVQAHRHLRRRVRLAHGLHVFDLRGAVRRQGPMRSRSFGARKDRHPRRRPEPDRAGDRVRLLLLPRLVLAAARRVTRRS